MLGACPSDGAAPTTKGTKPSQASRPAHPRRIDERLSLRAVRVDLRAWRFKAVRTGKRGTDEVSYRLT